ncbi:hypothetical protein BsWGS_08306 [Bradybaena similaris]
MMTSKKESVEVSLLREKIRLKKIDRNVYVNEMENLLAENIKKRRALRIGNECLRFMTRRQNTMSVAINAKIFEKHPNKEKMPMLKCTLTQSIMRNDNKLFKLGKKLMKQDYKRCMANVRRLYKEEDVERHKLELIKKTDEHQQACEAYLSAQVKVEDFKNKEVSAKLVFQELKNILGELEKDLKTYPDRIKDIEVKIVQRSKEVADFQELEAGAKRYQEIEESQLGPLNDELKLVNNHFEKFIGMKKRELEDRRKNNSLAKFLSEREAHGFSFTGSSSITEMKMLARNKALMNAEAALIQLMDAMMVNDVKFVVDCILDQEDVSRLLKTEKRDRLAENTFLKAELARLQHNNEVLKFDDVKLARVRAAREEALRLESQEKKRFNDLDASLRQQDKLLSDLSLALHAMFERLRPVKMAEAINTYKGSLIDDIHNFTTKLLKMRALIEDRTVPVGRVKPLMLRLFKEKRIPGDYARVEFEKAGLAGQIQQLEIFESDQPGYTSRDMLKARAEETLAKNRKIKAP